MKVTIYELLGLIKDGKAPKRIKYDSLIWTLREQFNDYFDEEDYLFFKGFDEYENTIDFLNSKVEIIEEVEDKKYKDIEELKIECMENQPSSKYIVDEYGKKCFLTKHSKIIADKVNELIKNQKYILERLDK